MNYLNEIAQTGRLNQYIEQMLLKTQDTERKQSLKNSKEIASIKKKSSAKSV